MLLERQSQSSARCWKIRKRPIPPTMLQNMIYPLGAEKSELHKCDGQQDRAEDCSIFTELYPYKSGRPI